MRKECLKGCPKGTKLKVNEHPGYEYNGIKLNTFMGKSCVVSHIGAFFGHVARFKLWVDVNDTDCLTVFTSPEARAFANYQMEAAK